ncbi:MAG: response regulator transcription factor [Clostridiales bacterium]|nr:response regulator transcription factor [Clostridiales bacterium]
MRILYAEDEFDMNKIVSAKLQGEGHSVDSCFNGDEAVALFDDHDYDLIILDVMMPGKNGYDVLRHIRGEGDLTPVLFLTARDAVEERIRGLDCGANDYLVKPFALEELMARIRAVRRSVTRVPDSILKVADLSLDMASHKVIRAGREIKLSSKEYRLLEYLMQNAGIVLTRAQIEDQIMSYDYDGGTNVVDVYIRYLRSKIDIGSDKQLIQTVRGTGYVIRS